jgi:hypothetical protein
MLRPSRVNRIDILKLIVMFYAELAKVEKLVYAPKFKASQFQ